MFLANDPTSLFTRVSRKQYLASYLKVTYRTDYKSLKLSVKFGMVFWDSKVEKGKDKDKDKYARMTNKT